MPWPHARHWGSLKGRQVTHPCPQELPSYWEGWASHTSACSNREAEESLGREGREAGSLSRSPRGGEPGSPSECAACRSGGRG